MLSDKELESGSVGKVFIKHERRILDLDKMCHSHRGPPGRLGAEGQTLGQAGRLAELGSARDQGSPYKVEND